MLGPVTLRSWRRVALDVAVTSAAMWLAYRLTHWVLAELLTYAVVYSAAQRVRRRRWGGIARPRSYYPFELLGETWQLWVPLLVVGAFAIAAAQLFLPFGGSALIYLAVAAAFGMELVTRRGLRAASGMTARRP